MGRPRLLPLKNCLYCGKEFYARPSEYEMRKFCSHDCYSKYYTRWKIEERECESCGETFHIKENSEQSFCSHKCSKLGNLNPNWLGGKKYRSRTAENDRLRNLCFERDDYTCLACKERGGELNAHHLNNYSEFVNERFDLYNLVTLCYHCHTDFHKKFGNKCKKENFYEYLKTLGPL